MLKFLVMSDLHMVPQGQTTMGLCTRERFERAIEAANTHYGDFDFCVIAGDLADNGEPEAYEHLKEVLPRLNLPVHFTLGNHDDRGNFLRVFGQEHACETGHVCKAIDANGHRVILLDSLISGAKPGELCPLRLAWLAAKLQEAQDKPVFVVLHHNANRLFIPSDRIMLENPESLFSVLRSHPDVRHVIAGHVHLTTSGSIHGIPVTTISGNHYSLTPVVGLDERLPTGLDGPAQFAAILSDGPSTTVHFHDYCQHSPRNADVCAFLAR